MRGMAIDLSLKGLENGIRLMVPLLLLGVLFLFSVTALPWSVMGAVKPQLVLVAIYYWAIYRPTLVPPYLCFAVGLMIDIISGLPLGLNAVVLTLVQLVVRNQRQFLMAQAYFTIWAVFVLVGFLALFLEWGMFGLAQMIWPPILPVMLSATTTVLLFPVVTFFLVLTHRILPITQTPYS